MTTENTHLRLLILLFLTSMVSCGSPENNRQENKDTSNPIPTQHRDTIETAPNTIETTLKSQLLKTYGASNEVTDIKYFEYDRNDLDASVIIVDELLRNAGYIANKANFEKKVKQIFDGAVKSENFLYIDNFKGKCSTPKTIQYFDSDGFKTNYYFALDKQLFVGQYAIPELIDYKNRYPEIAKIEETIETEKSRSAAEGEKIFITRWKDVRDLEQQQKFNVQLLINRNLYLFNDDKSRLPWLLKNDESFMKSLLLKYGWTEDGKLLKWVIKETPLKLTRQENNAVEYGSLIYHKDCSDKVKINEKVLMLMAENDTQIHRKNLMDYIHLYLANPDLKKDNELTFPQIAKITAYALNFIINNAQDEQEIYQYQGLFAESNDHDNRYTKEFKKNNYYGINGFKEKWQQAKQEGDGISLPGEE